jgi:hypothetical protein
MMTRALVETQAMLLHKIASGTGLSLHCERWFRRPPHGSIGARWEIHVSGYVSRMAEALQNDYPAVHRIVGSRVFRDLARRYLGTHPSRSFDLGRAGQYLPAFLRDDTLSERLPFLPDLARLEWAIADACVAVDAEPLRWRQLTAFDPATILDLQLKLIPGTSWIGSDYPLLDLWECRNLQDHEISIPVEGRESIVLVHRSGLAVRCRSLRPEQAMLLAIVRRGCSLAELLESPALALRDAGQIDQLTTMMRQFVELGLITHPGSLVLPAVP